MIVSIKQWVIQNGRVPVGGSSKFKLRKLYNCSSIIQVEREVVPSVPMVMYLLLTRLAGDLV